MKIRLSCVGTKWKKENQLLLHYFRSWGWGKKWILSDFKSCGTFLVALEPGESNILVGDLPPTLGPPVESAALSVTNVGFGSHWRHSRHIVTRFTIASLLWQNHCGYLYGQLIRQRCIGDNTFPIYLCKNTTEWSSSWVSVGIRLQPLKKLLPAAVCLSK